MSAQIVDSSASGLRTRFPGLGAGQCRFVAVEMGFEFGDAAEGVVFEQIADGEEVGVPAAV